MHNNMVIRFNGNGNGAKGYCELTKEMDSYIIGGVKGSYSTYVLIGGSRQELLSDGVEGHVFSLRVPGATRGHFSTDKNDIIDTIKLYTDTCFGKLRCYDQGVEEILEKYIGRQIKIILTDA